MMGPDGHSDIAWSNLKLKLLDREDILPKSSREAHSPHSMTDQYPRHRRHQGGFSLVEMLVVVAVIGVIAGIALPNIGSINDSAKEARDRRNAQSIVSVYGTGAAAGITWRGRSRNAKINSVVRGAAPADGAFAGKSFKVPSLSTSDRRECHRYIGIDARGDLVYDSTGSQPGI
jgi:type IV pilus assembly protein PilA